MIPNSFGKDFEQEVNIFLAATVNVALGLLCTDETILVSSMICMVACDGKGVKETTVVSRS